MLETDILEIEKKLNYKLPEDYKEYMINNKPLRFHDKIVKTKNDEKLLDRLFSFDPSSPYFILRSIWQNFEDDCDNSLIAIGLFANGDLLCFDRKTNNLVIYFHEKTNEYEFLSNSFIDFLGE